MGYLYCTGSENSLFECSRNVFSVVSGVCANHYYDVGVNCEGKCFILWIIIMYIIIISTNIKLLMILKVCKNGTIRLVSRGLETDDRVEVCI